jgi:diguanylate cyclase (GGDEF)-like protein
MNQRSLQIIDVIPEEHADLRDYARILKNMQDYLLNISKTINHEEIITLILKEICDKAEVDDSYLIIKNDNKLSIFTYGISQDISDQENKKIIDKATEIWQEQPHFEKEQFIFPTKITPENHLQSNKEPLKESQFNFMISIPIMLRGQVFGVLFFSLESFHDLSETTSQYFHLISKMSSSSLDNAFYHLKTKKLAHLDGLTGLNNHQAFQARLTQRIKLTQEEKSPLSLILFDIDNFKKVNDSYGHQSGDEVLKRIGKILREDTRIIDFPARYGGEEFIIILPETNISQGHRVSERIRELIEGQKFKDTKGNLFAVTISLGLTSFEGPELISNKDIINQADQALYEAKRKGKNQTIIFEK